MIKSKEKLMDLILRIIKENIHRIQVFRRRRPRKHKVRSYYRKGVKIKSHVRGL